MYKLISATPSPYARKVRIALAEKGIPFELLTEVPWNETTITPQYNPLEKLPVLIGDSGEITYESSFILQVLDLRHPHPPLLPDDVDGKIAARRLEVLCDGVCDAAVLMFFERQRPDGQQSPQWQDRQRRKIVGGVAEMAKLVGDQTFAVGDRFGLGDIAVGTALGYLALRFAEFDWAGRHPNLAALSARVEARPSFAATRPFAQIITGRVV